MVLKTNLPFCHDFVVIIDTNRFFISDKDSSFSPFYPHEECEQFFIERKNRPYVSFGKYFITEMAKQEIIQQKKEQFEIRYKKEATYWHLEIKQPDFEKDLNEYLIDNHIETLPYPKDNVLSQIINRAIEKRPPFEGKDKRSDKGFKDVISWESILNYDYEKDRIGVVFLITHDGIFVKDEIKKEFCLRHPGVNLEIYKDWQEFKKQEKVIHAELIAQNNINYARLLEIFQENDSDVVAVKSYKNILKGKENSPIVEIEVDVVKKDNTEYHTKYYYDITVNEPTLDNPEDNEDMLNVEKC